MSRESIYFKINVSNTMSCQMRAINYWELIKTGQFVVSEMANLLSINCLFQTKLEGKCFSLFSSFLAYSTICIGAHKFTKESKLMINEQHFHKFGSNVNLNFLNMCNACPCILIKANTRISSHPKITKMLKKMLPLLPGRGNSEMWEK